MPGRVLRVSAIDASGHLRLALREERDGTCELRFYRLDELAYDTVAVIRPSAVEGAAADTLRCIKINPASLRDAISVRFSDLKIRSVGEVPDMNIEEER